MTVQDGPVLACGRERTAVGNVVEALGALRHVDAVDTLVARAVAGACAGCGFDRVLFLRVDGSVLVTEAVHVAGDPEAARLLREVTLEEPLVLDHALVEADIVRRRRPALVRAEADRPGAISGLLRRMGNRSYVAAPIMPEGRALGLLIGDRSGSDDDVDDLDRDLLWAFAEGVASALQRIVLRERLQAQRAQVQRMLNTTAELARTACEGEITLGTATSDTVIALRPRPASDDRLQSLLTARELEVLELVAQGETNAGIADRLVISEGTVKSHVKSLLRKLRVANRAEAVSRYHRIAAVGQ